jgi:hypothetical protein
MTTRAGTGAGRDAIRSTSSAQIASAISAFPGSTVVSAGTVNRPSAMLSNPITWTSSGTRRPASASARSSPIAAESVRAKIASNSTP